jgi:hypothetical protein
MKTSQRHAAPVATRSDRPVVISIDDIRSGDAAAPQCFAEKPRRCDLCGADAVLPLNARTRMAQPDATTHVCHPVLGGCNHGFTVYVEAQ